MILHCCPGCSLESSSGKLKINYWCLGQWNQNHTLNRGCHECDDLEATKIHEWGYMKIKDLGTSQKAMASHSSTLAWKIPWMEEPGRLQSVGLWSIGHDWATSLSLFTFMHWRGKWQPTPVFLPGESQGWGSLVGCCLWGRTVGYDWSNLAAAAAGGPVVKNPPSSAGDVGSILGQGTEIPHAAWYPPKI